jgi:hypothetical protein
MPVGVKNSYVSKGSVVYKVVWPGKAYEICVGESARSLPGRGIALDVESRARTVIRR